MIQIKNAHHTFQSYAWRNIKLIRKLMQATCILNHKMDKMHDQ